MNEPDAKVLERQAWQDLVASEGWQLFLRAIAAEWSDEKVLERIRAALVPVAKGDQAGQQDVTMRVLAAQDGIRQVLGLPASRLRVLARPEVVEDAPIGRRRAG